MDFKLIYEFYALILFSAQRWCRIDVEAYCIFYFFNRRDHSAICQRATMVGYVGENSLSQANLGQFFVNLLIF